MKVLLENGWDGGGGGILPIVLVVEMRFGEGGVVGAVGN